MILLLNLLFFSQTNLDKSDIFTVTASHNDRALLEI